MLWIILAFFLNLGISWLNAWGAGRTWRLTQARGGLPHLLNWCAAIMSACGFTWCYSLILVGGAYAAGKVTPVQAQLAFNLGYVLLAPAVVGTGIIITVNSWVRFFRDGGIGNLGVAAYNTWAQYENTRDLIGFFPGALSSVTKGLSSDDSAEKDDDDPKGKLALLCIVLVVLALAGGILTTRWIILRTASETEA